MLCFLHFVLKSVFCCFGKSTNHEGGQESPQFRSGAEDRSTGSERVPLRVESAPKCVERHKKNAEQTAAGQILQVMISETSPLNPLRNDQFVPLVQVKKPVFSRATHNGETGA
ncbi:hypothetical protein Pan241w_06740 [Gimesia alba]|uniref:Uncharacterized protein n=1 Tax=Gimesia alba TaxID=2527973 RepID=A0A517R9R2_9PLAN|nr:hypothetical protein [Gimesia alba]QDT40616.1 hypothetical protein Pan241w_06740 [Gimesia alba]